ncbi:MAG: methyltransferase domain-containing protein, partial [Planctomycetota bacterium]|nr:methyltransferase domain-containing protein [Planctomycetota bacterium]
KLPDVDIVCDIRKGLPMIKSEAVEEIYCSHILEHISNLEEVMREFHRILKTGGRIIIRVPHVWSPSAFGDPTHCRYFTYETFRSYDKNHTKSYYYDFHFRFISSRIRLDRNWHRTNLFDKVLEWLLNIKQRRGEKLLKVIPYGYWEVLTILEKE